MFDILRSQLAHSKGIGAHSALRTLLELSGGRSTLARLSWGKSSGNVAVRRKGIDRRGEKEG
jgi:hypothetical protein